MSKQGGEGDEDDFVWTRVPEENDGTLDFTLIKHCLPCTSSPSCSLSIPISDLFAISVSLTILYLPRYTSFDVLIAAPISFLAVGVTQSSSAPLLPPSFLYPLYYCLLLCYGCLSLTFFPVLSLSRLDVDVLRQLTELLHLGDLSRLYVACDAVLCWKLLNGGIEHIHSAIYMH